MLIQLYIAGCGYGFVGKVAPPREQMGVVEQSGQPGVFSDLKGYLPVPRAPKHPQIHIICKGCYALVLFYPLRYTCSKLKRSLD